jgi:murein DD-endopeptidase MepM/ murein hydrolase activator NlpD
VGDKIRIRYSIEQGQVKHLNELLIYTHDRKVTVYKDTTGYKAITTPIQIKREIIRMSCALKKSVLASGLEAGMPKKALAEVVNIYSPYVDFKREISGGQDRLSILVERLTPENLEPRIGKIIFTSLTIRGKTHNFYLFKTANGSEDFFNDKYQSVRRSLLQRPIRATKITSKFGMRIHPILGYRHMHSGVDFAAPIGTPVAAAGNGVVVEMGRKGGYGNYIQVRHSNGIATAYAHLSSFSKGITIGSRVKQGQLIAYVGRSGNTSGPHLHFEVLVGGTRVDPLKLRTFPIRTLSGNERAQFIKHKSEIDRLMVGSQFGKGILTASLKHYNLA